MRLFKNLFKKKESRTVLNISGKYTDVSKLDEIAKNTVKFAEERGLAVEVIVDLTLEKEGQMEKLEKITKKIEKGLRLSSADECETWGWIYLISCVSENDVSGFIKKMKKL